MLNYSPIGFVVMRTPLLPANFADDLICHGDYPEKLKLIFQNQVVREAIFLASPSLYYMLESWFSGKELNPKQTKNLVISFAKYILRMAMRPAPFNLFSGNSVGKIGEISEFEFDVIDSVRKSIRPDFSYIFELSKILVEKFYKLDSINFFPNSSLLKYGKTYRYYRWDSANVHMPYKLENVEITFALQRLVEYSIKGKNFYQLVKLLTESDIPYEEAERTVRNSIENELLVSEFLVNLTGTEYIKNVTKKLLESTNSDWVYDILFLNKQLEEANGSPLGTPVEKYERIYKSLDSLGVNTQNRKVFYSTIFKPTKLFTLSKDLISDLISGLEVLNKITPYKEIVDLEKFKSRFKDRYQGNEVPLLEVLDIEAGIGFQQEPFLANHQPFLADIDLPAGLEEESCKWDRLNAFLYKLYTEAISESKYEVEIDPNDISDLSPIIAKLPDTLPIICRIYHEKKNGSPVILIEKSSGSASNILGRFCHDHEIMGVLKEIIQKEENINSEKIVAEIVYAPDLSLANISYRSFLREYEIPYLVKGGVPEEKQIKLDDLLVSLRDNKIKLRSKRLDKEIITKLSTAHGFHRNALPVYYFLSVLQIQDMRPGLGFSWGNIQRDVRFLPRVTSGNCILSRAQWNFSGKDINCLEKVNTESNLQAAVSNWKNVHGLPKEVLLAERDNELYINFESSLCCEMFISEVKNKESFTLLEVLESHYDSIVNTGNGVFSNQFVIPFYKGNLQNYQGKK